MLSVPHLIIIFAVALVVFGPQKLPELARTLGKLMADFRRVSGDLRSTFDEHMRELDREAQILEQRKRDLDAREAAMKASPVPPAGTQLADAPPPPVQEPSKEAGQDLAGAEGAVDAEENRIGGGITRGAAGVADTVARTRTGSTSLQESSSSSSSPSTSSPNSSPNSSLGTHEAATQPE